MVMLPAKTASLMLGCIVKQLVYMTRLTQGKSGVTLLAFRQTYRLMLGKCILTRC